METASLIILIVILCIVLTCLGILVTMLHQDKKDAEKLDLFLDCFSEFTSVVAKYFELIEGLIRKKKDK